jgi:hypothetical protein
MTSGLLSQRLSAHFALSSIPEAAIKPLITTGNNTPPRLLVHRWSTRLVGKRLSSDQVIK